MSTPRQILWLYDQIPDMLESGVLDEGAATRIRNHFGEPEDLSARSIAIVLFSVLGAALVGGGVILLLAHNWHELSRPVRTVIALLPVAISLGLAAYTLWQPRGAAWREGVSVGWILSLGAALALIEQTYQIGGDYETFMLSWLLLAAPVPWLLRSVSGLCLYLVGLAAWVPGGELFFGNGVGFWGLLLLVLPLLWLRFSKNSGRPSAVLLSWVTSLVVTFGLGFSLNNIGEDFWPVLYAALFATFFALGGILTPPGRDQNLLLRPFRAAGVLGTALLGLFLSYETTWYQGLGLPLDPGDVLVTNNALQLGVAVCMIAALAALLLRQRPHGYEWLWLGSVPVVALASAMPAALPAQGIVNIYLFALGAGTLGHGFRANSLRHANAGMAVLAALTIARFFDSEVDMVVRGLAFIIVGLGFFAVNWFLIRKRGVE